MDRYIRPFFTKDFTKEAYSEYDGIEFEDRESTLFGPDGSILFHADKVTVPKFWSQIASDILAQKYFKKNKVPSKIIRVKEEGVPDFCQRSVPADDAKFGPETDARQVFHRLAGCWMYWGWKEGYFRAPSEAFTFYKEICYMLAHQIIAPNSPQFFNTGLHWAYGIEGAGQGHYFMNPSTGQVEKSSDAYVRPQPHACFIQSVDDHLVADNGIMSLWEKEARLFKYGSGTGTNFSNIRGRGEPLQEGGTSSGLMSFLKVGDTSAGVIKSGGTTRRAAKIVILNIDHPDVLDFIDWKVTEEQKVAALVAGSKLISNQLNHIVSCYDNSRESFIKALADAVDAGVPLVYLDKVQRFLEQGIKVDEFIEYNTDWNSEAYATVSGQNSNNSLRIPDKFMKLLLDHPEQQQWELFGRVELRSALQENRLPKPLKTLNVQELWTKVVRAAWACADPGLQFHDVINQWNTCAKDGEINASNPCAEYNFLDNTACNLASMNLLRLYTTALSLNLSFEQVLSYVTAVWTVVLDISVSMAQYPSAEIAKQSMEYRTLGLGYANLGALLMYLGIPYESAGACSYARGITALMQATAFNTSALLAIQLGPFPAYSRNKESVVKVALQHMNTLTLDFGEVESKDSIAPIIPIRPLAQNLYYAAKHMWDEAITNLYVSGLRNAQLTVIAPTGTIGLLMDCDTTGVEPDFSLVKFKKLAGGGYFKIVNGTVTKALEELGYTEAQRADIDRYMLGNPELYYTKELPINIYCLPDKESNKEMDIPLSTLKTAMDIRFVLPSHILEKFSQREIDITNEALFGTLTIEGAPHVKPHHYPVFDCASKCGVKGTRYIKASGHLNMLGAVQPFISGGISKTVNLPAEATVEDVSDIYIRAWKLGIKCVAIYRDGSKLSQPLNTNSSSLISYITEAKKTGDINKLVGLIGERTRSIRNRLPNKRIGYTQKAKVAGNTVYIRTGDYENGSLGEVFLDMYKEGAAFRSLLNSFAIAISLGLQYGVPLEEFVDAFVFTRFEPSGPVVGNDSIKMATSVIDYIFRDLAIHYLDRHDLSHITVLQEEDEGEERAVTEFAVDTLIKGYTGDICPDCKNATMVRNGTCLKCVTCGSTTGCS